MKEGWEYRKFESCLVKVPKQVQVKSKDYKKKGKYPIVSQEAELISGYWDDGNIVYNHKDPVVIFGDHTKNIKYVDFNFVVGADGTHILSTKSDINVKFFYYVLKTVKLRELGYARHYKLLKEKYIPVPPLSEQQSIVDYLDSAFAKIDAMKANAEKALNEAKALFQASLREMLEPKEGWEEKKLGDVCVKSKNIRWDEYLDDKIFKYIDLTSVDRETLTIIEPQIIDKKNAPSRAKQIVKTGDIIFANTRPTLRRVCMISESFDNQICSTGFCVLRPKEHIISKWIFYSLLNEDFYKYIEPLQTGASYPAVTDGIVKKYPFYYPSSITEQQSIVATLDSLKSKVDKLQANYDKISQECDALKQSILRQIFE